MKPHHTSRVSSWRTRALALLAQTMQHPILLIYVVGYHNIYTFALSLLWTLRDLDDFDDDVDFDIDVDFDVD